ncbi:hypothetical protein FRC00_005341 [Tulasnella sp. 408]|nr:hypothetical protein FRC00_005341 [Tulasnella sp. 408]
MLEIQGAEGLPKWNNATRTSWDMDPFCVISFGKKSFDTRIVRHELNPVWNQKLLFQVPRLEPNLSINFHVLDYDKFSINDSVGSVSFALQELMASVPQPDSQSMIYPESATSGEFRMTEYKLPIVPDKSSGKEFKGAVPVLKFRCDLPLARREQAPNFFLLRSASYQPYHVLRQKLWRQFLKSYDVNGDGRISHQELTSLLGRLGTTLSEETIDSFFTRDDAPLERGDLTFEQALICLEGTSMKQRRQAEADRNAGSGSSFKEVVERAIDTTIRVCPVCHIYEGEADIVTHYATFPSLDWERLD